MTSNPMPREWRFKGAYANSEVTPQDFERMREKEEKICDRFETLSQIRKLVNEEYILIETDLSKRTRITKLNSDGGIIEEEVINPQPASLY